MLLERHVAVDRANVAQCPPDQEMGLRTSAKHDSNFSKLEALLSKRAL